MGFQIRALLSVYWIPVPAIVFPYIHIIWHLALIVLSRGYGNLHQAGKIRELVKGFFTNYRDILERKNQPKFLWLSLCNLISNFYSIGKLNWRIKERLKKIERERERGTCCTSTLLCPLAPFAGYGSFYIDTWDKPGMLDLSGHR